MTPRHAPFYCEENVWWLGREPSLAPRPRRVLFITNGERTCAMRHQRAAPPGEWLAWDYHVVLVVGAAQDESWEVWDLDCRLGAPVPLGDYLDVSFHSALPERFQPRFRVVDADTFYRTFASDRAHMRDPEGGWRHPPPSWPPIGEGSTLDRFLDVDDPTLGPWCDRAGLVAALGHDPRPHSK